MIIPCVNISLTRVVSFEIASICILIIFFAALYLLDVIKGVPGFNESVESQRMGAVILFKYPKIEMLIELTLIILIKAPAIGLFYLFPPMIAYTCLFFIKFAGLFYLLINLERYSKRMLQEYEQTLFVFPAVFLCLTTLIGLATMTYLSYFFYFFFVFYAFWALNRQKAVWGVVSGFITYVHEYIWWVESATTEKIDLYLLCSFPTIWIVCILKLIIAKKYKIPELRVNAVLVAVSATFWFAINFFFLKGCTFQTLLEIFIKIVERYF